MERERAVEQIEIAFGDIERRHVAGAIRDDIALDEFRRGQRQRALQHRR